MPISLTSNQTQVTVDTEYDRDRYPISQMSHHESDVSTARGTGGPPGDAGTPHGLSFGFDSDLESGRENRAPA